MQGEDRQARQPVGRGEAAGDERCVPEPEHDRAGDDHAPGRQALSKLALQEPEDVPVLVTRAGGFARDGNRLRLHASRRR